MLPPASARVLLGACCYRYPMTTILTNFPFLRYSCVRLLFLSCLFPSFICSPCIFSIFVFYFSLLLVQLLFFCFFFFSMVQLFFNTLDLFTAFDPAPVYGRTTCTYPQFDRAYPTNVFRCVKYARPNARAYPGGVSIFAVDKILKYRHERKWSLNTYVSGKFRARFVMTCDTHLSLGTTYATIPSQFLRSLRYDLRYSANLRYDLRYLPTFYGTLGTTFDTCRTLGTTYDTFLIFAGTWGTTSDTFVTLGATYDTLLIFYGTLGTNDHRYFPNLRYVRPTIPS